MELKLSENIKSFRVNKALTQKDLATALAVSPQAVSRWEQGQAYPDVLMLDRLATYFGVTLDALVGRGVAYVEGLKRELHILLREENSVARALKECDLLEKLALAGHEQIPYLNRLISYKCRADREKGISTVEDSLDRRIESARTLVKELIKKSGAEERLCHLQNVLCAEEEEHLEDWKEFITEDFECSNYSDLLLNRYRYARYDPEKFDEELQKNTYRRISALLLTLVNDGGISEENLANRTINSQCFGELHPVCHYETLLDTLNVYSKNEGDVFLFHRTLIVMKYAAALFKEGREEDGFEQLENVKRFLLFAEERYFRGEKIQGSIPLLAGIEETNDIFHYGRIMEVVSSQQKLPEFAPVREDLRFQALIKQRSEIYERVTLSSLKKEGRADFETLLEAAKEELKKHSAKAGEQVILMQCRDRKILCFFYNTTDSRQEQDVLSRLAKENPLAEKIVVLFAGCHLDVPSYAFRKKLLELHRENGKAQLLLQGYYEYHTRTLILSMPPKDS